MRSPGRSLRLGWALAAPLACATCAAGSFSRLLPVGIPDVAGWEKIVGQAELDSPHRFVAYQLFVRPGREAAYEVIRYRVTLSDAAASADYQPNERLQWDLDGRTLRRFELVPGAAASSWQEMTAGSDRFRRETGVILSLMGLHRELLYRRDRQRH